ncbi:MAG: ribosome recycling factor [Alphaproteobacteria bacterium]|nr:ribosome recycling factor [Alphaproteobacteria bacterium]MAS46068.1 ribosome recycling factor [Alphaproteobacteria bacterium]MAX95749.1 ribosome recycling factor [Alphaproteobacteria bacterium]MBN54116.1 ribosome recycling factor [Alphaproteobacteria bacterium]OUT42299.1 MAG: ribosome recycling factor [Micavibrio sp. TMED2]|tara:strand:- start:21820 stop:22380 length:561 start_codon:yes stop_codon:yes gene_type:complete
MSDDLDMKDLKRRMEGALENFHKELAGLRTGRASVSLLEPVQVDAYGSKMPLNQVASVSAPEPRLLTVQVWDAGQAKAVEKAIREAGLGLNPQGEGTMIRVPIPDLNEERRNELVKVAGKYAEQTRIAIRNIRRDGMDTLKRLEKDSEISQDDRKSMSDDIQSITDEYVKKVDDTLAAKESEITTV